MERSEEQRGEEERNKELYDRKNMKRAARRSKRRNVCIIILQS